MVDGPEQEEILEQSQNVAPFPSCEPNFSLHTGELAFDYWKDWLLQLASENTVRIAEADEASWEFLTRECAQFIFTVCVRLRMPNEVRFSAAFIFEQYMKQQTKSLWTFVAVSGQNANRKEKNWEKIEANLSRQIPLRALSAIQIASKNQDYHTSLSTKQVVSALRSLGCPYTNQAVLRSELRVLKMLGFSLPKTPITYVECILKCVRQRLLETSGSNPLIPDMDWDGCWHHTLLLLDVVLMHHKTFYEDFVSQTQVNGQVRQLSDLEINRIKMDWMMLGAGVVCAAVTCVHGSVIADEIVVYLPVITGLRREDITNMATILFETILKKQTENDQKRQHS